MDLTSKKILMVIARDTFRDEEYAHPREVFEKYGAKVTVATSIASEAVGRFGLKVMPDIRVKDVDAAQYDGVVFVGGGGAREYFNDPAAHSIAKSMLEDKKIVTAICIAPGILAIAGLLNGVSASVFPSENDLLVQNGATLTGKDVTVDGQIITANGPEAAYEFGETVAKALAG